MQKSHVSSDAVRERPSLASPAHRSRISSLRRATISLPNARPRKTLRVTTAQLSACRRRPLFLLLAPFPSSRKLVRWSGHVIGSHHSCPARPRCLASAAACGLVGEVCLADAKCSATRMETLTRLVPGVYRPLAV